VETNERRKSSKPIWLQIYFHSLGDKIEEEIGSDSALATSNQAAWRFAIVVFSAFTFQPQARWREIVALSAAARAPIP
jgi:hypothetical protein